MPAAKRHPGDALGDASQSLQGFDLVNLQQFTLEKTYSSNASKDFHQKVDEASCDARP